jgi:hypothetical protein
MAIDLKPCPMCAGRASIRHTRDADNTKWLHVECGNCGCRTRGKWTAEECPLFYAEVRDEWNTRAESSPQAALVPEVGREEPVAWRYRRAGGGWLFGEHPLKDHDNDLNQEPLYTRPAATPEAVRLREALEEVCLVLESGAPAIVDTVWVSSGLPETLLDHCRAALDFYEAALSAPGEGKA